jgi:hypothetical protein
MSKAIQQHEDQYRHLEDKYAKLKEVKKLIKACSAMECGACKELVQVKYFVSHLSSCSSSDHMGKSEVSSRVLAQTKKHNISNKRDCLYKNN